MNSTTSGNIVQCFFCNCDLSTAYQIQYVAEGPICSICLAKMAASAPVFVQDNPFWTEGRDKQLSKLNCTFDNGDSVLRCSITGNPVGTDTIDKIDSAETKLIIE